jgi:hypothetical protein
MRKWVEISGADDRVSLLSDPRARESIDLFRLVTIACRDSLSAVDSPGGLMLKDGQADIAIKNPGRSPALERKCKQEHIRT